MEYGKNVCGITTTTPLFGMVEMEPAREREMERGL